MDLMELRRSLLDFDPPGTYCGIPVYLDNARLPKSNGSTSDVESDNDWFITGWFDSGDSTKKAYTYFRPASDYGAAAWRVYDDKDSASVDWWAASAGSADATPTVSTTGRYVLFSVYKPLAYKSYMMQGSTYLFKGKGV